MRDDEQTSHAVSMAARILLQRMAEAELKGVLDGHVIPVRLDDLLALRNVLNPLAGDWKPELPMTSPGRGVGHGLRIPMRRADLHDPEAAERTGGRLREVCLHLVPGQAAAGVTDRG